MIGATFPNQVVHGLEVREKMWLRDYVDGQGPRLVRVEFGMGFGRQGERE